jgi:hypothetical protein
MALQGTKNERRGNWRTIAEEPVVVNGMNYVTNRIARNGKFYRLVPQ